MKPKMRYPAFLIATALLWGASVSLAGWTDALKGAQNLLTGSTAPSDSDVISGLKEALRVGTGNAVSLVSAKDGYLGNPSIRIPLPGSIEKASALIRAAGYGDTLDRLELSMNRAAERAAPEAKAIFVNAIQEMTFQDAKSILNGRDNEATLYFQDKTSGRLSESFNPIIHSAMSEVGVTKAYQDLDSQIRSVPFVGSLSFDLDQYVTTKSLDGLFFMLAQEERKIRTDPAARVTDLLKKVFGAGR